MIVTSSSLGNSQEVYNSIDLSFDNKSYDISISYKSADKYTMYMDMIPLDDVSKSGGIILTEKYHSNFVSSLDEARLKYIEWVNTAKENNVTELTKSMPIKCKTNAYFLYGSKWNFQYSINITFDFKISNGSYLLIIRTGSLVSASNQYMKSSGFVYVFQSDQEIENLSNLLNVERVHEYITEPKASDLFKD